MSGVITNDVVVETFAQALRREYGGDAKRVARESGSGKDAARNWIEGRNAMSLTNFLRLCQSNPTFFAEAKRLVMMDAALDPQTEAEIMRFAMSIVRHRGNAIENRLAEQEKREEQNVRSAQPVVAEAEKTTRPLAAQQGGAPAEQSRKRVGAER
jgi:hypothetical protein